MKYFVPIVSQISDLIIKLLILLMLREAYLTEHSEAVLRCTVSVNVYRPSRYVQ